MMGPRIVSVSVFSALVLGGCYSGVGHDVSSESATDTTDAAGGEDDDTEGAGGDDEGETGDDAGVSAECMDASVDAGYAPIRRLTRREYANTVEDLLGVEVTLPAAFEADSSTAGFAANNNNLVSQAQLEVYLEFGNELAADVVAIGLEALPEVGFACAGDDMSCMRSFVEEFSTRAFRRPALDSEVERYLGLYEDALAQWDTSTAQTLLLSAVLQSPNFLYLPEAGDEPGADVVALTQYEVASRLSYMLWKSMPDDALFDAAASGALGSEVDVRIQVERMLADPRAKETIKSFHGQWLHIEDLALSSKDATLFPQWNAELANALVAETLELAVQTIWSPDGDGTMATLFSTATSYLTPELEEFYGITAIDGVADFDPAQRAGIFTHPSVMARHAHANNPSWTQRGSFIRQSVLCQPIPPPPADVDMDTQNDPNRLVDPACASCHLLMDPIGAGFENYDAIGRYRETFPTLPEGPLLPARVEGGDQLDVGVEFSDGVDLAAKLATSEAAASCLAKKWFTYAAARAPTPRDECAIERAQTTFVASDADIRELIVAIVGDPSFGVRRIEAED